ncbi:MAG: hypothetical protein JW928_01555 [Candidatus Aureabacteria bacterium]|nr:hypothetical protein [Candidatus Auribacterota bacterium]
MNTKKSIQVLFGAAAVYDGVLGIVFIFLPGLIFSLFQVTPPNHMGYVQFPAALLIVFALLFVAIARQPKENRTLIPYGILLKVSYCGVVFWHWFTAGIPGMWKPFAVIDIIMGILFFLAYLQLGKEELQNE